MIQISKCVLCLFPESDRYVLKITDVIYLYINICFINYYLLNFNSNIVDELTNENFNEWIISSSE